MRRVVRGDEIASNRVRSATEEEALVSRLATFGQGVAFGEMALLDGGTRSADVVCDGPSRVAVLPLTALHDLEHTHPGLRPAIQSNLARLLARRLRAANAQIRALAR